VFLAVHFETNKYLLLLDKTTVCHLKTCLGAKRL
jgi:hypothetical protein